VLLLVVVEHSLFVHISACLAKRLRQLVGPLLSARIINFRFPFLVLHEHSPFEKKQFGVLSLAWCPSEVLWNRRSVLTLLKVVRVFSVVVHDEVVEVQWKCK
jgi:hypothetical protein